MKITFKQHLITSIACSAVFAFILTACGGKSNIVNSIFSSSKTLLASAPILGGNLVSPGSSNATLAAIFQTATPVTTFAQSFHGRCLFGPASPTGIFTNNTASDLYVRIEGFGDRTCQVAPFSLNDLSDKSAGAEVIDSGSLSNLIVAALEVKLAGGQTPILDTQSGQIVIYINGALSPTATCTLGVSHRCSIRTLAVPVLDGDRVSVYERVAPGKDFEPIEVYLTKS
jgi:hypothetical protein